MKIQGCFHETRSLKHRYANAGTLETTCTYEYTCEHFKGVYVTDEYTSRETDFSLTKKRKRERFCLEYIYLPKMEEPHTVKCRVLLLHSIYLFLVRSSAWAPPEPYNTGFQRFQKTSHLKKLIQISATWEKVQRPKNVQASSFRLLYLILKNILHSKWLCHIIVLRMDSENNNQKQGHIWKRPWLNVSMNRGHLLYKYSRYCLGSQYITILTKSW